MSLCNSLIFSGHACADVSFDGNFIVSCSYDETWKLWATDEYIFENETQPMKMATLLNMNLWYLNVKQQFKHQARKL